MTQPGTPPQPSSATQPTNPTRVGGPRRRDAFPPPIPTDTAAPYTATTPTIAVGPASDAPSAWPPGIRQGDQAFLEQIADGTYRTYVTGLDSLIRRKTKPEHDADGSGRYEDYLAAMVRSLFLKSVHIAHDWVVEQAPPTPVMWRVYVTPRGQHAPQIFDHLLRLQNGHGTGSGFSAKLARFVDACVYRDVIVAYCTSIAAREKVTAALTSYAKNHPDQFCAETVRFTVPCPDTPGIGYVMDPPHASNSTWQQSVNEWQRKYLPSNYWLSDWDEPPSLRMSYTGLVVATIAGCQLDSPGKSFPAAVRKAFTALGIDLTTGEIGIHPDAPHPKSNAERAEAVYWLRRQIFPTFPFAPGPMKALPESSSY